MDKLKLFEAMNLIDDDIIKDAGIDPETISNLPASTENTDDSVVTGVDIYHRRGWQRFAAAAASILLIAGLSSVGILLVKNSRKTLTDDKDTEIPTSSMNGIIDMPSTAQGFEGIAVTTGETGNEISSESAASTTDVHQTAAPETTSDSAEGTTEGSTSTDIVKTVRAETTTVSSFAATTADTGRKIPETTTRITTQTTTFKPPELTTTTVGTPDISRTNSGDYEVDLENGAMYEWFSQPGTAYYPGVYLNILPETVFRTDGEYIWYERDGDRYDILGGFSIMPTIAYFKDLNDDSYPELSISYTWGSGIGYNDVLVYDIRNDTKYVLEADGLTDYFLTAEKGRILVKRLEYANYYRYESEASIKYGILSILNGRLATVPYNELTDKIEQNAAVADITRDGRVSIADALAILRYISEKAGKNTYDTYKEAFSDINCSGEVEPIDCSILLVYLRKINIPGDINEDGRVDSADAEYMKYYIDHPDDFSHNHTDDESLMQQRCETFGDLNMDGKIDENDLEYLR